MKSIQALTSLGQSLWYDNIQRSLLDNGELKKMITLGEIRGVTSNPSIFNHAITHTSDYEDALIAMAWSGWQSEAIFWQLAKEDIQRACDLFDPLYRETAGEDGYVSLEVHPGLAHDGQATLEQAQHLWRSVDRPNLMIKIPATRQGLPAIRAAIALGINVNVTLIFSIERYREVMDAYLNGLDDRLSAGVKPSIDLPASVSSFFISRMDTKVDALLPEGSDLRGKAAIANARLAYQTFRDTFDGPRWERLRQAGARLQRPLWASTSTKNPAYPDTLYLDNLIGEHTVNTVPPQTLDAFRDHGRAALTLNTNLDEAQEVFKSLEGNGISIAKVTEELEQEGVKAFEQAFSAMLTAIETRRKDVQTDLANLKVAVEKRVTALQAEDFPRRLWNGDTSLWTDDPEAGSLIHQRLGWLSLPETARRRVKEITALAEEIRGSGIRKVLLLGMGGSSLAPEVMATVFPVSSSSQAKKTGGIRSNDLHFAILDSTDPIQVAQTAREFPPDESLYIVASKSGGTVEVSALLEYFWDISARDGSRFVAITDPGTSLEALAKERQFRAILRAETSVGGRFSVLTDFGLFPMALMGLDLNILLDTVVRMMRSCNPDQPAASNPGVVLGALLGEAVMSGRDKLTLLADPPVAAAGWWLEQLIAESSGKDGKGIIVIEGEEATSAEHYGCDRLFIHLKTSGEMDELVAALRQANHPVVTYEIHDIPSMLAEFYRWEIATATACHILEVNAFDQPDVQDNKERTRQILDAFRQKKQFPEQTGEKRVDGMTIYSAMELPIDSLRSLVDGFLSLAAEGDHIAINAYLPRNSETKGILARLRHEIWMRTGCATSLNFGPRFLHSTGQLHKGGPNTILFLQITAERQEDTAIPGEPYGFRILEQAQALGDFQALQSRGRRILRVHLPSMDGLRKLNFVLSGTNG